MLTTSPPLAPAGRRAVVALATLVLVLAAALHGMIAQPAHASAGPATATLTIQSVVDGSGASGVPTGFTFSVTVSYVDDNGNPQNTTKDVAKDGATQWTDVPTDRNVNIARATPTDVPGVAWGSLLWSEGQAGPDGQVIFFAGDTTVVMSNYADSLPGSFAVDKVVGGPDEPLVPEDYLFRVTWEYFIEGRAYSGEFRLTKNGPPQGLSDIPPGTVITLSEATPVIEGVEFRPPVWTGSPTFEDNGEGSVSFRLVRGDIGTITLENPTGPAPTPTPTPTPTSVPTPEDSSGASGGSAPELAATGSSLPPLAVAVGALLLGAGIAGLVLIRRRRLG